MPKGPSPSQKKNGLLVALMVKKHTGQFKGMAVIKRGFKKASKMNFSPALCKNKFSCSPSHAFNQP
jgi:hypothetical protein